MALARNDPAQFYPDQASVDNSTPVNCRIEALHPGGVSLLTLGDPVVGYGPGISGDVAWTKDATVVPIVGIGSPVAYSVDEVDSISANADAAASAGANASFSELLAKGLLLPVGLIPGYTEDGWGYHKDTGIWDRRFANDELYFTFSVYGGAVSNVFVLVQDLPTGVTGQMTVEIAFWERTTGAKVKTLSVVKASAGSGFTQPLDLDITTIIPSAASEMTLKVTTGADVAPAGGPFYVLKQIYWLPV